MEIEMRKMLVSLSNWIQPEDLNTMKFFCKGIIPTRARDTITTAVDLFEKLEERGKIQPGDLSFLETLLKSACAGRTDLIDILNNYKEIFRSNTDTRLIDKARQESLLPTFHFLAKNMGKEYRMVLRRLGVPDSTLVQLVEENPHNVQEVIHRALAYWYQINSDSACQENITEALQAEKRNDLALRLVNGDI